MRIGCLQFAPQVGDVDNNLNRADSVLSKANPEDLDLLVLPELAFTGYNFKSLQDITPFLEPSGSGITSLWARTIALKYNCTVTVGYPEKVDPTTKWPTGPEYYNSAIVVNGEGETIANYRKSFLYYTDTTWALEGGQGFYEGMIPGLGNTSIGICMDIKFEAPWNAFEFAFHVLEVESNLVIVSMAWMTREDRRLFTRMPNEPDMETLTYWVTRLEPLIRAESKEEIIVVFCNRAGIEDDATYAGTSAVVGIQDGEVKVYGLLGRGQKDLLLVDTNDPPYAKLVYRPNADGFGHPAAGSLEKHDASGGKLPKPDTDKGEDSPGFGSGDAGDKQKSPGARSGDERQASATALYEPALSPFGLEEIPPVSAQPDASSPETQSPSQSLSFGLARNASKKRTAPPISIPSRPSVAGLPDSARSPGAESAGIRTPSASSPTAVRPRLIIPESPPIRPYQYPAGHPISASSELSEKSVQSFRSEESVQTVRSNPRPPEESTPYPDSSAPLSGYPANYMNSEKRIYGGEVSIAHEYDSATTTPFDDISPVSSTRMFWRPSDHVLRTPLSATSAWSPGTPIGRRPEPFPWPLLRPSPPARMKSENATPSDAPSTSQDARSFNSQSPQSNASSNHTKKSASSARTSKATTNTQESSPARPCSPKSRNASRSRMNETSDSEVNRGNISTAISQHLENIAHRVDSVNRMRSESASGAPVPERPPSTKSRNHSRSRPNDPDFGSNLQSIPIVASPSLLNHGRRPSSDRHTPGPPNRPASRASVSRRRSSSTFNNWQSGNTEERGTPGTGQRVVEDGPRAASRGRQPGPSVPSEGRTGIPDHERSCSADSSRNEVLHSRVRRHQSSSSHADSPQRSSGSRNAVPQEVDVSQFERVEAVLCPNCPVHGGRSSADSAGHAGHHHHAPEHLIGSAPDNEQSGENTPPATATQTSPPGVLGHPADMEKTPVAPAPLSNFYSDSQDSASLGSTSNENTETSDYASSEETPMTISTPGRSPATPSFFNPTTPKAMVFNPDELDQYSSDTPVEKDVPSPGRCSDGDSMQPVELSREPVS